jgi:hypothetical protein
MGKNTTTHNGDSKSNQETDKCTVIVTSQEEVGAGWELTIGAVADVIHAEVVSPKKIKDGVRPEKQGDSIDAKDASELGGKKMITVISSTKKKAEKAPQIPENESQKASRKKLELSQRAEEKYNGMEDR